MSNILKHKDVKGIEWILKVYSYSATYVSNTFSFKNHKYYFILTTGSNGCENSHLYISVNGEFISPVTALFRINNNSGIMHHQTRSISMMRQEIWSSKSISIISQTLNVEVNFQVEHSKDDKSTQTPSYIDARFLLGSVSDDFSKLLDEGLNHDVDFTCGDQIVRAHKNILCSRSDVFASMLQSDMVEGNTGHINIQDMDADIFLEFLKYLYTGVLPELTIEIAMEFYKAGDKYAIESLKNQCGEFLTDNLSLENACEILILADRHNDVDFKKKVMEYMFKEEIPIVGENWNSFCKGNSNLAIEALNLFCQYLKSK